MKYARPLAVFIIILVLILVGLYFADAIQSSSQYELSETIEENFTPPDTNDPFTLGQYYFNQDENHGGAYNLKEARKYFNEVIRENPKENNLAWYQLGRIDFIEGYFLSALYKFNKQIEYFGNEVPNVYYMIGLTYGNKAQKSKSEEDWGKAEEGFRQYLTFAPTAPWPRVDLAWVYFSQGKFSEMIPTLKEGLKHNPDQAWLLNSYGLALLNTGEKERAYEQFVEARNTAAKLTIEDWGNAYSGNNPIEWEDGLQEFRQVIETNITLSE